MANNQAPTIQGFIDFVNSQDPNKIIDQSSWSTCAVGKYYNSINRSFNYWGLGAHCALDTLYTTGATLCEDTYGEMQDNIKLYLETEEP